ncbi:hypothetical protein RclHR1_27400002 [Rhizophagus clarus]|uniref:Uncharacterized protein n=1 Tax=Rhizophagus clarus TaxID=94130 RepID=A0A2Z6R6A3_9GLOM|nr:hypothetical protein RclHR1_27400002 [Rhizophagus clarus]
MNIYNDAVSADIKNVDIVSDHHMLLAKFMRGCIMPHHITIPKITPSSRILYEYEKLTETAKKNMNQLLTQELDIINSQFHLKSLNDEWSNIKMAILNIKNQLIPSKEIKLTTHDDSNSFKNLVLYPIIRYFITLRQKFKKPFGLQHIKKNWYCIVKHITRTLSKGKIDNIYYLGNFRFNKRLKEQYIKEVNELYDIHRESYFSSDLQ